MTSKFSSFARLVMFSIAVLAMAAAAHGVPLCYGGSLFRVGGNWQGCIFPGPTWDSFQHSMCQGAVEIPSSADATCHLCVEAAYVQDVQNGNWQNMSPSALTCVGCVAQPPGLLGRAEFHRCRQPRCQRDSGHR